MGAYLAFRIMQGVYSYSYVISKRGDLKKDIDSYLKEKNREDLIVN